jgi:hypothetical protein
MPSELRASYGVTIFTPHAVKFELASMKTWNMGEFIRRILYSVKRSALLMLIRRGLF